MMRSTILHLLDKIPGWKEKPKKIIPLSGGITNQNFCLEFEKEKFVLRLFQKDTYYLGIQRENEYTCTQIAMNLGIGPEVLYFFPKEGFMIVRFIEHTEVTPEMICKPDMLKQITNTIKTYHHGPKFPGTFSPFEIVENYYQLALKKKVSFPNNISNFFSILNQIKSCIQSVSLKKVPCHNDLLAGNVLQSKEQLYLIDWEYAAMGDPFFDLANLSVNNQFQKAQDEFLLKIYLGSYRPEDMARLSLMKLVSDARESFWGFLQSGISTLEFDFLAYAQTHLDRFFASAASKEFQTWQQQMPSP